MFRKSVNVGLLVLGAILLAQSAMSAGNPYLGISLAAKIPPALAAQLKIDGGAMIIAVADGSPAARAGLKEHDIIIEAAGSRVKSPGDLKKTLGAHAENENLELIVRRGTATLEFSVKLVAAPPKRAPLKSSPARPRTGNPPAGAKTYLGVRLAGLPPSLAAHLRLSPGEGALVEKALPGSPAYNAGIRKHDVILKVAGKGVTSSKKKGGGGTIIFPDEFNNLQLRGIRGGITGGLRLESFGSLFGDGQNDISSNLNQLIAAHQPGDEVELGIVRAGEKKKLKVVLAASPSTRRPLFPPQAPRGGNSSSSSVSSVTVSDGDLTITVRNNNGKKTFSARRGGEVLAEDEPWDALDKMPADVQKSIRRLKVRTSGDSESGAPPPPAGKKKNSPGQEKRKSI